MLRRALIAVAAGKALAVAGFIVTASTGAPSGPVTPGPAVAPPGATVVSASTPFATTIDAAWRAGGHVCGEQTAMLVDHLAGVLEARHGAGMLDARVAAAQYVRDRCA